MEILDKVKAEILSSVSHNKSFVNSGRTTAALTLHHFDKFTVEECHNGREEHPVIFRGETIARINSDEFYALTQERKNKVKSDFLTA